MMIIMYEHCMYIVCSDIIANVFTKYLISETTLQVKFTSLMTNTATMTTLTVVKMMKTLTMRTITAVVSFEMAAPARRCISTEQWIRVIFLSPTWSLGCDDDQDHDYDCDDWRWWWLWRLWKQKMMNGSKVKECNVCFFLWGSAESAGR